MMFNNTKILATLGPATNTYEAIEQLHLNGVNSFRINFSHGDQDQHAKVISIIRKLEEDLDHPIAILADLQGPKLRIGRFIDGHIILNPGDTFILDNKQELGNQQRVFISHPELFDVLENESIILLDDGRIQLKVTKNGPGSEIITQVIIGGALSDNKGLNVPGVELPIPALTKKDQRDLAFILAQDIDWVMLSFVQKAHDITNVRQIIDAMKKEDHVVNPAIKIMAKIEMPSAIDNIEEITQVSDGICVARGDLALELGHALVPAVQKTIVQCARKYAKPVVIATQMMDSMVNNPTPTRAEVSDVANAVFDLCDCVMLSNETAVGKYCLDTIKMVTEIITKSENNDYYKNLVNQHADTERAVVKNDLQINNAIALAAKHSSGHLNAKCMVVFSMTGTTGLYVVRERFDCMILMLTSSRHSARIMQLSWGIKPLLTQGIHTFNQLEAAAREILSDLEIVETGDHVVISGSDNIGNRTDSLRIIRI